jgi:hypothetical protein
LDCYVPSHFDKARLIAEAEAIERSETLVKPKSQETKEKKSSKSCKEKKSNLKNGKSSSTEYFCTKHGANKTHGTADCFTIKNRNGRQQSNKPKNNRSFSTDKYRQEINFMSKEKTKEKF